MGPELDLDEGSQNVRSALRSKHRQLDRSGPFRARTESTIIDIDIVLRAEGHRASAGQISPAVGR